MALSLETLQSNAPLAYWRKTSDLFTLAEKAKLSIRTKAQGGEWVDLLDSTVPNNKVWVVQISILAQETDPTP